MPQHDAWRVHGWMVGGAWCSVLGLSVHGCSVHSSQFFDSLFTVFRFTVFRFIFIVVSHGLCHFERSREIDKHSSLLRSRLRSFSTPLEMTDLAWKVEGMNLFSNKQNLTISILEKMLRANT